MVTIVTSKNYINCEKVNYITIQSEYETVNGRLIPYYQIFIHYIPISYAASSLRDAESTVCIRVIGEKTAHALFKDMVSQIREQCPDQLYLDKLTEKYLSGSMEDTCDDIESTAVYNLRKKESRSKALSRRARGRDRKPR